MLSTEGRSAYAEWRGEGSEEGSCRGEDLSSACDAAITSLSSAPFDDWLEIESCAKNQSLFCGEPAFLCAPVLQHILHAVTTALYNTDHAECRRSSRQYIALHPFVNPQFASLHDM